MPRALRSGTVIAVDRERYEAIRELLEAALANADDDEVRHSVRNALQLLVGEQEAPADED